MMRLDSSTQQECQLSLRLRSAVMAGPGDTWCIDCSYAPCTGVARGLMGGPKFRSQSLYVHSDSFAHCQQPLEGRMFWECSVLGARSAVGGYVWGLGRQDVLGMLGPQAGPSGRHTFQNPSRCLGSLRWLQF